MKNYKNKQLFLKNAIGIICLICSCKVAHASKLYIKNEESVEVNLIIEPGEGRVLPNSKAIKTVLKPGETKKIEITKENFNSETFTVTGKVSWPSIYNKCKFLMVNKDYNIFFISATTGGTICIADPV